ncbi:helix-turn-helix domain-containing protein [Confluentibacter citreus]|uniref:helix-turn-helix domain-containing protein n=1 Tax=Confluentibacter citreus TaxID=2007307 RepID=UPI001EFE3D43|nr:helix-turn-helix domain-containing protein [Confluentibacter citreus]
MTFAKVFHFMPFLLVLLAIIPFLLLSSENKIMVYQNDGEAYSTITSIIFSGIILSGVIYSILSIRSLIKHKNEIKENYSYTEKINLQWLFKLVIGLSCIWIIVFFADDEIIFSSVVLFVLLIGYYGIKQVGIFNNPLPPEFTLAVNSTVSVALPEMLSENVKYEKSSLTDDQIKQIHDKLLLLMKEKKLHLTPELTLTLVSQELNVHPNTLSQVINSVEQKNFFDYINTLRVEEFKERVSNPENQKYTLLFLAYECGFNSKTSFNRNFKNLTGKSPTEYLKEIKITLK